MPQIALDFLRRYLPALSIPGLSFALVILFYFNPAESAWYPRCVFHELSGWHCPGCGTLRAGHLFLHGDFRAALSMNVLAVVFPFVYLVSYFYRGFRWKSWRRFDDIFVSRMAGWTVVVIVSAFWVLRNVDSASLNWLAP